MQIQYTVLAFKILDIRTLFNPPIYSFTGLKKNLFSENFLEIQKIQKEIKKRREVIRMFCEEDKDRGAGIAHSCSWISAVVITL